MQECVFDEKRVTLLKGRRKERKRPSQGHEQFTCECQQHGKKKPQAGPSRRHHHNAVWGEMLRSIGGFFPIEKILSLSRVDVNFEFFYIK
jgi:hypothetical protein